MIACLRPISIICIAGLLAACASQPSSTLGELPRTPQANIEQLLQQAAESPIEQAAALRLSAADLAYKQKDLARASSILEQVQLESLKPAQQIYASTLRAELDMSRNKPKAALRALSHPSMERLGELPVEQQVRSQLVRANALQATGQILAAARERAYIAPLLSGASATANQETIWALVSSLPQGELQASGDADLDGWLELARASKSAGTLEQQQSAIDAWVAANPQHPAAQQLPQALVELKKLSSQPLTEIALLLPQDGQLASVARALRDGFLAAHYQAQQAGQNPPNIQIFDSSRIGSMDAFYTQAQASGVQLVIGPLEKNLVSQLSSREQLPITTLALNYSEGSQEGPAQLFQFGLAAEDEAREVARRAWADGMRRAVALVPNGEWGDRVLAAFRQSWQAQGGTLIAAEHVDQPVELARQSPTCSNFAKVKRAASACRAHWALRWPRLRHAAVMSTSSSSLPRRSRLSRSNLRWPSSTLVMCRCMPRRTCLPAPTTRRSTSTSTASCSAKPHGYSMSTIRCANKPVHSGLKLVAASVACMPWAPTPTCWHHASIS